MTAVGYPVAVATGAKQCECGNKLRSDNKSGLCHPCYEKQWHKDNSGHVKAQSKEHYEANRERYAEWFRQWSETNPDKAGASGARYRVSKLDLFVEEVRRDQVLARDRGRCHLCLKQVDPHKWHLDHVIALAARGPHCYANVAVSHPRCNMAKGDSSRSSDPVRWTEATAAFEAFHGRQYK